MNSQTKNDLLDAFAKHEKLCLKRAQHYAKKDKPTIASFCNGMARAYKDAQDVVEKYACQTDVSFKEDEL